MNNSHFFVPPLNKSTVLGKTNRGWNIFKYYIADFKEDAKPFKSVFRTENNPSANVFKSTDGNYLYKDFGDNEDVMDAINFVMKLKKCNYYQALIHINKDLKLELEEASDLGTYKGGGSTEYWHKFVEPDRTSDIDTVLIKYGVEGVKSFVTDSGFRVTATSQNPAFAFSLGSDYTKIYRPLEPNPKHKHLYLGSKPIDYHNIFGIDQLPEHCTTILLVEGLKDSIVTNANLNQEDIYGIGLDNVSTNIKPEIFHILRSKCNNLVLCLDTDEVGLKMSDKKSQKYGIRNLILPAILQQNGGKDISDWFKLKLDKQILLKSLGELLGSPEPEPTFIFEMEANTNSPLEANLFAKEKLIDERSSQPIVYSPPLIYMGDVPIIRRCTINIIQGKYGAHKSRIAELFCSLLLTNSTNSSGQFLQFEKTAEAVTVLYIDTERSLEEELPAAIQSIKKKAFDSITYNSKHFRFTSIKSEPREIRLKAVKAFVEGVRSQISGPIFVLLDVVTDCVSDFNNTSESMKLFDYLGNLCDSNDCTFLLVIHQNPGSDKARGHTGTEAVNKATTVMQIGFEKGKNNEDSDVISLKFLKTRSAKRPNPLYLRYDGAQHGLVLAHQDDIQKITAEKRPVADTESVADRLGELLKPFLTQQDLSQKLKSIFGCSENTIKCRLMEIADQQIEIINERGHPCTLQIKTANGKATIYELQEIDYILDID